MDRSSNMLSQGTSLKSDEFSYVLAKAMIMADAAETKISLKKLSDDLENSPRLREDAILNGKAVIKNWKPLTSDQIDKIIFNMIDELMA